MRIKYILSKDTRSESFSNLIKEKYPEFLTEKDPEVILVSGGDGAFLHAVQKFNSPGVSFLGRAAGTLNFFMNKFSDDEEFLKLLLQQKLDLRHLSTNGIRVEIRKKGKENIEVGNAINEIVIGADIMGYYNFSISSEDSSFNKFKVKGTGICISTDMGSTGYNFNLGGVIVPLGSGFWSLRGIATNRYINDILKIQEIEISCLSLGTKPWIFIDGIRSKVKIEQDDKIVLTKGENIEIIFLEDSDFAKKRIEIMSRYRKD